MVKFIIIFLFVSSFQAELPLDIYFGDIPKEVKGGYKSCNSYIEYKSDDKDSITRSKIFSIFFNEAGKISEYILWALTDSILSKSKFIHDDNGKLIEIIGTNNYGDINSIKVFEYRYDSIGQLINRIISDTLNNITYDKEYIYDSNGTLVQNTYLGLLSTRSNVYYEYNQEGKVIKCLYKNLFPPNIFKLHYNNNGSIDKVMLFDEKDLLIGKLTYNYDYFGNIIEFIEYEPIDKIRRKLEFIYSY